MRLTTLFFIATLLVLDAAEPGKLPEGPGRATTARLCGSCHGFGNFVRRRESRDGWNAVIEEMISRGAKGEEEEWAEVSDYLVAQFSPVRVNVNRGTAAEISEALGLRQSMAEALVRHREANGPFRDLEGLRKVPALAAFDLESRREQIEF